MSRTQIRKLATFGSPFVLVLGAAALVLALSLSACTGSATGPGDDGPGGDPDVISTTPVIYFQGPLKLMAGEAILDSIQRVTGSTFDSGAFDLTHPDPGGAGFTRDQYFGFCTAFEGCKDHRIPAELTAVTIGLVAALQLDRAAFVACNDRAAFGMFPGATAPGAATTADDVINFQYRSFFGVLPSADELTASRAYFDAHVAAPELGDVSAVESAGRGLCRALINNAKFLYY